MIKYPRWNDYLFVATLIAFAALLVLALLGYREGARWALYAMLVSSLWRAEKQRDHLEKLLQERGTP